MTITRKTQIGIASGLGFLSLGISVFYATYFAAFFVLFGFFVYARLDSADELRRGRDYSHDIEDYKLVKHLCGLAAWIVLVLTVCVGRAWTAPEEARGARVFESCVEVGMPGKCADAMDRVYGKTIPPVMWAVSSSVDWRKPVASCRLKPDFTQCVKELTQVTDGTSVTVTRDDVTRICKGADRAECFGGLQKAGLVYSNLAVDDTAAAPAEKD